MILKLFFVEAQNRTPVLRCGLHTAPQYFCAPTDTTVYHSGNKMGLNVFFIEDRHEMPFHGVNLERSTSDSEGDEVRQ